jgi:hypothetical protein
MLSMTPTSRGTDLLQLFQGNQQQVLIAAAIIGGLKQELPYRTVSRTDRLVGPRDTASRAVLGRRAFETCSTGVGGAPAESGLLGLTIGKRHGEGPTLPTCALPHASGSSLSGRSRVSRALRWAHWGEGRLRLDRFPQRWARDFLPLRCAHSSRDKKISSPASFAVLQPQAVRFNRSSPL